MNKTAHSLICAMLATVAVGFDATASTKYPEKPISIIVTNAPGNTNDVQARVVASKLSERFGQAVVVENRPGAGGKLGTDYFVRTKPDGYTLMVHSTSLTTAQATAKNPSYDVERDFIPISLLASEPMAIVVSPSLPVDSVADFIEYVKKNPGKVNFGSTGNGGIMHINSALLGLQIGGELVHVPYGGGAPAVTALMGGEIHMLVIAVSSVLGQAQAGKVKILAVGSKDRVEQLPDIPTTAEASLPFEAAVWFGLFARAGTPPDVVERLTEEVSRIVDDPAYRSALIARGQQLPNVSSEEFRRFVPAELAKWREVISRAKIELQ